jgi:hypothetical protein
MALPVHAGGGPVGVAAGEQVEELTANTTS